MCVCARAYCYTDTIDIDRKSIHCIHNFGGCVSICMGFNLDRGDTNVIKT